MLNNIGLPGLLLIAVVVLVLFGRGKISGLMGVDDSTKELDDADVAVKDVTPEDEKDKA